MLLLYADFILQGKDNANRRQYKTSLLVFIVEVPPILFKDSANPKVLNAIAQEATCLTSHNKPCRKQRVSRRNNRENKMLCKKVHLLVRDVFNLWQRYEKVFKLPKNYRIIFKKSDKIVDVSQVELLTKM